MGSKFKGKSRNPNKKVEDQIKKKKKNLKDTPATPVVTPVTQDDENISTSGSEEVQLEVKEATPEIETQFQEILDILATEQGKKRSKAKNVEDLHTVIKIMKENFMKQRIISNKDNLVDSMIFLIEKKFADHPDMVELASNILELVLIKIGAAESGLSGPGKDEGIPIEKFVTLKNLLWTQHIIPEIISEGVDVNTEKTKISALHCFAFFCFFFETPQRICAFSAQDYQDFLSGKLNFDQMGVIQLLFEEILKKKEYKQNKNILTQTLNDITFLLAGCEKSTLVNNNLGFKTEFFNYLMNEIIENEHETDLNLRIATVQCLMILLHHYLKANPEVTPLSREQTQEIDEEIEEVEEEEEYEEEQEEEGEYDEEEGEEGGEGEGEGEEGEGEEEEDPFAEPEVVPEEEEKQGGKQHRLHKKQEEHENEEQNEEEEEDEEEEGTADPFVKLMRGLVGLEKSNKKMKLDTKKKMREFIDFIDSFDPPVVEFKSKAGFKNGAGQRITITGLNNQYIFNNLKQKLGNGILNHFVESNMAIQKILHHEADADAMLSRGELSKEDKKTFYKTVMSKNAKEKKTEDLDRQAKRGYKIGGTMASDLEA